MLVDSRFYIPNSDSVVPTAANYFAYVGPENWGDSFIMTSQGH